MDSNPPTSEVFEQFSLDQNHAVNDYFSIIRRLVKIRSKERDQASRLLWQKSLDDVYALIHDEMVINCTPPVTPVSFGTSGWRGILGKDLCIRSVAFVTAAILDLYLEAEQRPDIQEALGVNDFAEMQERGCVVGFDNRFGGSLLARAVINVLAANNIKIFYAGEATTGILSAAVLELNAACSINLTPSHNPLEYGGFKYNAADAGPAAPLLTDLITKKARKNIAATSSSLLPKDTNLQTPLSELENIIQINALTSWQELIGRNQHIHGVDYTRLLTDFTDSSSVVIGIDAIHGASRNYITPLLGQPTDKRLFILRDQADITFGGIAPEPSSANMEPVRKALEQRSEPLKIGAVIDPDGDRIRFTDGSCEITMNQFGAMAYHFLHEIKGKKGMVAKTVATSNLANAVAQALGEDIFEPKVGFKEFKPVLGKALVFFEESDGISIIGHTPEKDAFIGLMLALDMVLTLNKNLGEYLREIEHEFGAFYPRKDGVTVSKKGSELQELLTELEKYSQGTTVKVGRHLKTIASVLTLDGRKMVFEDGSWIMIRPSGTEPKVRFYVEARTREETDLLIKSAQYMLAEIGLVT